MADDVTETDSDSNSAVGAGAVVDIERVGSLRQYAELVDTKGSRVWVQESSAVALEGELGGGRVWIFAENDDPGWVNAAPHLDAGQAMLIGEALLAFSRVARGSRALPPMAVGKLTVALARAWEKGSGFRSDGTVDYEAFAQEILDQCVEMDQVGVPDTPH